jgi:DNA-directed RNA polymerase specialized sigma24 family protein
LTKVEAKKELTAEKFAEFLTWLNPSAENSGVEYERLRFRLITFFTARKCRFSEELADETINRVALKIADTIIENKFAFCYGVAKNVFLESLRKEKEFLNIDELQIAAEEKQPELDNRCFDKCLGELPSDNRTLILDYFSENKSAKISLRERLADNLGVTKVNLRMKIVRIKQALKTCLVECV